MKSKKLFSIIFLIILFFTMPINAQAQKKAPEKNSTVILGGEPFGIKMFSDGVMVIKTQRLNTPDGEFCPAEEAGIRPNDVIITAQGVYIKSNEQLQSIIENSGGETLTLKIIRDKDYISTEISPIPDSSGIYKAGMWIKDSAAGIGTVTFYSEKNNGFCALGHGVCDIETGALLPIATGDVDKAFISSVSKSVDGNVGTLNGYFEDIDIGNATVNCDEGIYGKLESNSLNGQRIEIAPRESIKTGKAYIYTTVKGCTPQKYDAEIVKINHNDDNANLIVKITDEVLLNQTGGIVQGMSGSPIVQNGKLIGAVTHVMVDNVDCGYAIFADTMMEILDETCQ